MRRTRASMKAPPKRKGNSPSLEETFRLDGLNESPSEKEGKFMAVVLPRPERPLPQ